jgi:hypothetical protein
MNQIREKYVVHNPLLKQDHQNPDELINNFLTFNIQSIPRVVNHVVDTLVFDGLCFTLDFIGSIDDIKVQILHWPMLFDNVDSWKVFNFDKQIFRFLQNKGEFKDLHISHKVEEETRGLIQLKTNKIPLRLSMFDSNNASTSTPNINSESIRKVR